MNSEQEKICKDSEEFEALFFKYRPVVEIMYKKYYLKDYDLDDWMQEGRIVFDKCLKAFDASRGTTLGVLFKRSFENRICSLLRLQRAQKRKAQLVSSSLEEKIEHEGPDFLSDQNVQTQKAEKYLIL
jgi:RNA polymerase sporulation-specific sigma factor